MEGRMFICSLDEVANYRSRATHLISICDPDADEMLPHLGLPKGHRLVLHFHDLDDPRDAEIGFDGKRQVAPEEGHVRAALAFTKKLDSTEGLLIHCHQGISRSTALAFAVLCQSCSRVSEQDVLARVIELRREALPNRLVVKHADKLLGRKGRMVTALRSFYGKASSL
jgi:predicted protein tyrosine phosphatase